jgi:hypothetical protein
MQRKISGMNESWPCSRLMPMPWPWRSLAAYCRVLGDMWSIAPSPPVSAGFRLQNGTQHQPTAKVLCS